MKKLRAKQIHDLFDKEIQESITRAEAEWRRHFPESAPIKTELIDERYAIQLYVDGMRSTRFTANMSGNKIVLEMGMPEQDYIN